MKGPNHFVCHNQTQVYLDRVSKIFLREPVITRSFKGHIPGIKFVEHPVLATHTQGKGITAYTMVTQVQYVN